MDYTKVLYRRNNKGLPCYWSCSSTGEQKILLQHGIVGHDGISEYVTTHRDINQEINSRIKKKRSSGYKYLNEIKDSNILPVEKELYTFLDKYLPYNRTTADGELLHMLAKTFDNKDNKLFKDVNYYIGQWKINGERCFISAYIDKQGLFEEPRLKFQSRIGTIWNSLRNLEEYLLATISNKLLFKMIDENYILDGEIYLPGYRINEINHFIKDPNCIQNKLLQFWCYDIAIEDTIQENRLKILDNEGFTCINNKDTHLSNTDRFVVLPRQYIYDEDHAIESRDLYIKSGFEGLILRNPIAEYQYGKRNLSMIKFKAHDDGVFEIYDIKSEGLKRPDIPLFVCKNDINDELFEVHIGGSIDYQKYCFKNKEKLIGKQLYIEYGERSGVKQVPFHVKLVKLHVI